MHDARRSSARRALCACLSLGLAVGAGAAVAGGGHGGGGGGGDSSMNPYTGDSYAYFHGGRNLGESGTIRPGGTPPATGWSLWPARPARNDAARTAAPPTARYTPAPTPDATAAAPDARTPTAR